MSGLKTKLGLKVNTYM